MSVERSEQVEQAIAVGYTPVGPVAAVECFAVRRRDDDAEPYHLVNLVAGARRIQVSVSPAGRSVRVFVDGREVEPC